MKWRLRPTREEHRSPEELRSITGGLNTLIESYKTPEARGQYAAGYIWNALLTAEGSPSERENQRRQVEEMDTPSAWRQFYGMSDAARDLLKFNNRKEKS
jgi:hypothetical protein